MITTRQIDLDRQRQNRLDTIEQLKAWKARFDAAFEDFLLNAEHLSFSRLQQHTTTMHNLCDRMEGHAVRAYYRAGRYGEQQEISIFDEQE